MKPIELAQRYLGEHKIVGYEIKPKLCPFCKGGNNGKDTYTFALNIDTGAWNCLRGSCMVSGSFNQLLKEFGEAERNYETYKAPKITYTAPKVDTTALSDQAKSYLAKRGFSAETLEFWGITESKGNIVFPYYEGGKLVLVKYRKPEKYSGNGQKAWREEGGKAVFWGMDKCDSKLPLHIVEGEYDAMALTEAGVDNVVSVPSGASDLSCVENCWDWLQKFKQVVIWPDKDEAGQGMCRNLINKLGAWRCSVVKSDYKDANEALHFGGADGICLALIEAQEVPMAGLLRLADVKTFDIKNIERVRSSIRTINKYVGGYMMGMLSVWTGINSSGKSTFLGQELLEAVQHGHKVCVYSGEMPMPIFRYWVDLQAAGPDNVEGERDEIRDTDVMRVKKECVEPIRRWYRDKFFVYDSLGGVTDKNLLEVFQYASMRYGCKVFLVDNLMMMVMAEGDKDFYRRQSEFTKTLKNFAVNYDCHVHLVAHPRKTQGRPEKSDVMGSGDITNIADNVFSVYRVPEKEQAEEKCHNIVDIFKDRFTGSQGKAAALLFDEGCKRFYMETERGLRMRKYGWTSLTGGITE